MHLKRSSFLNAKVPGAQTEGFRQRLIILGSPGGGILTVVCGKVLSAFLPNVKTPQNSTNADQLADRPRTSNLIPSYIWICSVTV